MFFAVGYVLVKTLEQTARRVRKGETARHFSV